MVYSNSGASTGAAYNPFRYRGYYYDIDLVMYYLQSRYYDAKICRFINADSALYHSMLGYNMFAYCENNPVGMIDITGKYCVANIDDDGNPFDDWLHECAGGGGVKGNYNGPGSSYYTYQVRMGTASYDAHLGGYHSTGMSSAMYNLSYYSVAGAASASNNMSTHSLKTSRVRNPWGKKGGPNHQSTIQSVKDIYESMGYTVQTEVRIDIVGGYKPYRFADLSITDTKGFTFYINVGKELKSGFPCARERYAIDDIRGSGYVIFFVPYN